MQNHAEIAWAHVRDVPVFRAIIRTLEHRLLAEQQPFAQPLLDVGSGDGHFASVVLGGQAVVGIDISRTDLRLAQRRGVYESLVCASAPTLPFPSNHFATVLSNCVIEHIPDLEGTLAEMYRTTRPGGSLLLTVPTDALERNFLLPQVFRMMGLKRRADAYLAWLRRMQVHHHLYTPAEWCQIVERAGFIVVDTRGYLSPLATHLFELWHYISIHNLIVRSLTGRWVIGAWRPRFWPAERLIRFFMNQESHPEDSCLFLLAQKPQQ